MRRTLLAITTALTLASLAACGAADDGPPPTTTVTTEVATTTSMVAGDPQGIACLELATKALSLVNDFRAESRGVARPDSAAYREKAEGLRAEHASLGCPGELLKGFP